MNKVLETKYKIHRNKFQIESRRGYLTLTGEEYRYYVVTRSISFALFWRKIKIPIETFETKFRDKSHAEQYIRNLIDVYLEQS